jgi:hypothetical protein
LGLGLGLVLGLGTFFPLFPLNRLLLGPFSMFEVLSPLYAYYWDLSPLFLTTEKE